MENDKKISSDVMLEILIDLKSWSLQNLDKDSLESFKVQEALDVCLLVIMSDVPAQ